MERLLCDKKEGGLFLIGALDFSHFRALRLKRGERVEVFCEGRLFLSLVVEVGKGYALCEPLEEIRTTLPEPEVNLYQCVPVDLKLMEEVIDRASQTGARSLVPVVCRRGFQKMGILEEKLERWKRLSLASFKQCRRPVPLEIGRPVRLSVLEAKEEVPLVLDSFSEGGGIGELDMGKKSYGVVVGPEGGLSLEEVQALKDRGFRPLFLRPYILRTEMAGAVAVALIMNLAGRG